jgi:hypothetical protein
LNDAGGNASIERACREKLNGIKFKFSGPRIPQKNGKVKRKFQTVNEIIKSMVK